MDWIISLVQLTPAYAQQQHIQDASMCRGNRAWALLIAMYSYAQRRAASNRFEAKQGSVELSFHGRVARGSVNLARLYKGERPQSIAQGRCCPGADQRRLAPQVSAIVAIGRLCRRRTMAELRIVFCAQSTITADAASPFPWRHVPTPAVARTVPVHRHPFAS